MLRTSLYLFLGILYYCNGLAQIAPPGLGETNTAGWFAFGLKQKLNKKETLQSTSFVGLGTISNPDNANLFQKPSIYVVNEEITHHFKPNWKYSVAASYRWQNKYKTAAPYELDNPKARQEIRFYGKFTYLKSFEKMAYSFTYRPELRFFYNPDFSLPEETTEFRSRLKAQIAFTVNSLKTHKIIAATEALFATNKTEQWDKLKYKESRLSLYYSIAIPKQKITLNMGYMNNILGKKFSKCVHYIAFDVVLKNPFSKK